MQVKYACMGSTSLSLLGIGLAILLGGLPIVFLPIIYDVFELPKFLYLTVSFSLLILLLAWGETRVKAKGVLLPLTLFFVALLLSTVFSVDHITSFFGTYRRHEGIIAFTLYLLLFLLPLCFRLGKGEAKQLQRLLMVVTAFISSYALAQHFGYDFLSRAGMERSFSTLNHPNFLGAYLAQVMPFYLLFIFQVDTKWQRGLGVLGYGLALGALLYTYSRAAWLAALFSQLLFFWLYPLPKKKAVGMKVLGGVLIAFLIGSLPFLTRSHFTLYSRFLSIFNRQDASSAARLSTWRSAIRMGRDYPLIGVGLDSYKAMFPRYKEAHYVQFEALHITADKTHNEFLHYFATLGLIGFFAYLWLLGAIFLSLYRKRRDDQQWAAVWMASLFAYLVQAFFSFSVIVLGASFYAFAGIALGAEDAAEERSSKKKRKRKRRLKRSEQKSFSPTLFFIGVALLGVSIWHAALRIRADQYHLLARLAYEQGMAEEGVDFAQQSVQLFPFTEDYWIYLGKTNELLAAKQREDAPLYLRRAAHAFSKAIDFSPLNPYLYSFRGKVYSSLGNRVGQNWQLKALKEMEHAVMLDPENPVFMNNLAAVYNRLNKPQKAVPLLKHALKLTPGYMLAWSNLGIAYFKLKRYKESWQSLTEALKIDPQHIPTQKLGFLVSAKLGKWEEAKKVLSKLREASPDDPFLKTAERVLRQKKIDRRQQR